MKRLIAIISIALCAQSASAISKQEAVNAYAATAYQQYSQALEGARQLKSAIDAFLADPNEETMQQAREAWLASRTVYSPTEVYRFYGGPIDDAATGPEGALNAWPLDEAYIDYVEGDPEAGLIQKVDLYPTLNASVLRDLNEKDGEKNISTGYHAIEFMLWGQDLNAEGNGARPTSDFTTAPFAERRKAYLAIITDLLIEDLESVQSQWNPAAADSYFARFTTPANMQESLTNIFTGVVELAGAELSTERMFVALDQNSQEDEHSCFSDNTHNDILDNFLGVKLVLQNGLIDLIRASDEFVAEEIEFNLEVTEAAIRAIPAPFDQAIAKDNTEGNGKVLEAINALESLAEAVRQGAITVGVSLAN